MKNLFGLNRTITFVILGASFIFILGAINSLINYREKIYYQVISPNGEFYITNDVSETDGCVIFMDENEKEMKVCGSYQIQKI
jgi:hypothetical protein